MYFDRHLEGMHVIPSVTLAIVVFSGALLVLESIPEALQVTQFERIGLVGALVCAVAVLWRALAKTQAAKDQEIGQKDVLLIENSKLVVEALTKSCGAQEAMAKSNTDLNHSIAELRTSIAGLPCTHGDMLRLMKERG